MNTFFPPSPLHFAFHATLAIAALVAVLPAVGQEAEPIWQGAPGVAGDWFEPANWSVSSPERFHKFIIDNGGTAAISSGTVLGQWGIVGENAGGHLVQTGGRLHLAAFDPHSVGDLHVGYLPGSVGTYELSGGDAIVNYLNVGLLGEGHFTMTGGMLTGGVSLGGSTDAIGTVEHTGGKIYADRDLHRNLEIGRGSYGKGQYRLSGSGQIELDLLILNHGDFVQSGGTADFQWAGLGGTPDKPSLLHVQPGDHTFSVTSLSIWGMPDAQANTTFRQDGATVRSQHSFLTHGNYELNDGRLVGENLSVGAPSFNYDPPSARSLFTQSGGTVELANEIYVVSNQDLSGKTTVGRYELVDGTVSANRIRIYGGWSSAEFHQMEGRVETNQLELSSHSAVDGVARLRPEGGELFVQTQLVAGQYDGLVEFDFGGRAATIETGIGSYVEFGPNVSFLGAENATLRLGPESTLNIPPTLDLSALFGSFEDNGAVVVGDDGFVRVPAGQRSRIGNFSGRFIPGVIVDGIVYDDPKRGPAEVRGQFQVNPGGIAELGAYSHVIVTGHDDAGVFGGTTTVNNLVLGTDTEEIAVFTIDHGSSLDVFDTVRVSGKHTALAMLTVGNATLTADQLRVAGRQGIFRQDGGVVNVNDLVLGLGDGTSNGGVAFARAGLSNGSLTTKNLRIRFSSTFEQSGGVHRTGRLLLDSGTYRMSGGSLVVESRIEPHFESRNQIDLSGAPVDISVTGAILQFGLQNPFRNAANATLTIDEESLVVLPTGVGVESLAGTVQSRALVHRFGQPLTIPADRTIRGLGSMEASTVDFFGKLLADEGDFGIPLNQFTQHEGSEVDLGSGWAVVRAGGPELNSRFQGGTFRAAGIAFDGSGAGKLQQSGGQVMLDELNMHMHSTYELTGGELTVSRKVQQGTIDFAGSSATLRLGDGGFIELDVTNLESIHNAAFVGGKNSLMIVPPGYDPAKKFREFSTRGIVHRRGEELAIGADQGLAGNPRIDDDVMNGRTIAPGFSVGQLFIEDSDYHQLPSGKMIIEIAGKPLAEGIDPQNMEDLGSDQVIVRGDAFLDGMLEVMMSDEFVPLSNFTYTILSANSIHNQFANATSTIDVLGRGRFDVAYGDRSVQLTNFQPDDSVGRDLIPLMPGDANQDLSFDQRDLVSILVAANYLTARLATWGEGDWNGGPGGSQGNPPAGDGRFDQLDIVAALSGNAYLTGPYGSLRPDGRIGDTQTSVVFDANTGELVVDPPSGTELTSINIDSTSGIFTADAARNLGGSFDNDSNTNIFKATFGSSFGSVSFGNVAEAGLSADFILGDLSVIGSLAGGGSLGDVDLVYIPIPEPSSFILALLAVWITIPRLRLCLGKMDVFSH